MSSQHGRGGVGRCLSIFTSLTSREKMDDSWDLSTFDFSAISSPIADRDLGTDSVGFSLDINETPNKSFESIPLWPEGEDIHKSMSAPNVLSLAATSETISYVLPQITVTPLPKVQRRSGPITPFSSLQATENAIRQFQQIVRQRVHA